GICALLTLIGLLGGGWAAAGDPLARLRHGWDTFKSVKGYAANGSGNRLTSGLGSNRYDFYRVALDEFVAHPVAGIGADNFQQQYLRHGRSNETPHYPHSVELRTLTQTGLVGCALALAGLAAALAAGWRASRAWRAHDPLARDVAVAALGGFAYWLLHGSFDWFWEFAGLGAPAFALLGLTCALAPAVTTLDASSGPRLPAGARAGPPLRSGDLALADRRFSQALARSPDDAYATLERGAIASSRGRQDAALRLLARAAQLQPRDPVSRRALALARAGRRVSVAELNRSIL